MYLSGPSEWQGRDVIRGTTGSFRWITALVWDCWILRILHENNMHILFSFVFRPNTTFCTPSLFHICTYLKPGIRVNMLFWFSPKLEEATRHWSIPQYCQEQPGKMSHFEMNNGFVSAGRNMDSQQWTVCRCPPRVCVIVTVSSDVGVWILHGVYKFVLVHFTWPVCPHAPQDSLSLSASVSSSFFAPKHEYADVGVGWCRDG